MGSRTFDEALGKFVGTKYEYLITNIKTGRVFPRVFDDIGEASKFKRDRKNPSEYEIYVRQVIYTEWVSINVVDVKIVPTNETCFGIADEYDIISVKYNKLLHQSVKKDDLASVICENKYNVIFGS